MRIPGNRFTYNNHLTNMSTDYPFYLYGPVKLHDGIDLIGWCPGISLDYNPKNTHCGVMVFDGRCGEGWYGQKFEPVEYWFHATYIQLAAFFGNDAAKIAKELNEN